MKEKPHSYLLQSFVLNAQDTFNDRKKISLNAFRVCFCFSIFSNFNVLLCWIELYRCIRNVFENRIEVDEWLFYGGFERFFFFFENNWIDGKKLGIKKKILQFCAVDWAVSSFLSGKLGLFWFFPNKFWDLLMSDEFNEHH